MAEKDERFLLFVDSAIFVLDFLSVEDLLILSTVSPTLHSFLDEPSRCILWRRSLELEPLLISAESVSFASNRYDSTRIMRSFHRTSLSQNLDYLLSNIERYSFSKGIFTVAINRLRIISNDDFARANLIRTGVHEFICLQVHDCGDETKVISGLTLLAELMRPLPTHISANSIFNSISVDLSSWVLDLIRNCTNSTPHKTQVLLYAIRCGINLSLQPKQLAFMRKVKAHLLVAESIRHLIYCSDMFISVLIFAVYLMGNVIDTVNVIELEFEICLSTIVLVTSHYLDNDSIVSSAVRLLSRFAVWHHQRMAVNPIISLLKQLSGSASLSRDSVQLVQKLLSSLSALP